MLSITSPAFANQEKIPEIYTCHGQGINPPLTVQELPQGTKSLVLIMDDPDAPMRTFDHWLVWNISAETEEIAEDSLPKEAEVGENSGGKAGYYPPCPHQGTHRYFFKLYALDSILNKLPSGSTRTKLETEMKDHIIEKAELVGLVAAKN